MGNSKLLKYIEDVLGNMPSDWLNLTTHRLDIYNEEFAKTQFLEAFDDLFKEDRIQTANLSELPTAYDYIRLGHPLSCVLEWTIANLNALTPQNVISFSSQVMPIMAVLRKNKLERKRTLIAHIGELPAGFDPTIVRNIYGYIFDIQQVDSIDEVSSFDGSVIFISPQDELCQLDLRPTIDFFISCHPHLGSVIAVNTNEDEPYSSEIQHVRRRESIAMTPVNCLSALNSLIGNPSEDNSLVADDKKLVLNTVQNIVGLDTEPLLGSSGLSIQYAIMMGLIHDARENFPDKNIRIVIPPNCYGGTNDQARRVAATIDNTEVVDLPVDGGNDMTQGINVILDQIAAEDAIPYIIAEIPTNPRVEVPDLDELKKVLSKSRKTATGKQAIEPVFILDQTFCPNVQFLGENNTLSSVKAISYVSGSKFPSGGKCTAGYCVGNKKAEELMGKIAIHLNLCDNEATDYQTEILAKQLPSMNQRIEAAYKNTRAFVDFIEQTLPDAKINFVSKELAKQGFTPSVFSLDLPTKGDNEEARETYKRALNLKLINLMITEIPDESKYCVSYGQLKGCYWTIPATSTQGTTKESDKDYIARVALSPNMDLEHHKEVFSDFIESLD